MKKHLKPAASLKFAAIGCGIAISLASTQAISASRDYISIVGSSTVYPFATVVAERFGKTTSNPTPKIEATGSGGGMKLFCSGVGTGHPDITNASRRMKSSEFKKCQHSGVKDIVEVLIGFDGIVLANSVKTQQMSLTRKDIFLALAKNVPAPKSMQDEFTTSKTLITNPYNTWQEVNPALPNVKIEVLGPPPTSGTRDAFAELALEGGCKKISWIKAIKKRDKRGYKEICHTIREDGHYIEVGENDNLIVQKLDANPNALGVFGFSFLDQNADKVQGSLIEGQVPTFDTIADKSYPISRPLYFYVKRAHVGVVPGIEGYLAEFTSEKAWGEEGYLAEKGMIPLSDAVRRANGADIKALKSMTGEGL
ncbi:phosphate ABC transporter substrate-binding protein [Gammaproteobacteria bacterium 53_120_T64]|mgnify:CR=1 FL=1|nr:phosphate ABC transporter substrate-binding protein [Gammaproteobacteria bacterium 53_120_T64]